MAGMGVISHQSITIAPMMQKLTLLHSSSNGGLGSMHCPQIHTLNLWASDDSVKSLVIKPMLNVQHHFVFYPRSSIIWHSRLLKALSNLISSGQCPVHRSVQNQDNQVKKFSIIHLILEIP